ALWPSLLVLLTKSSTATMFRSLGSHSTKSRYLPFNFVSVLLRLLSLIPVFNSIISASLTRFRILYSPATAFSSSCINDLSTGLNKLVFFCTGKGLPLSIKRLATIATTTTNNKINSRTYSMLTSDRNLTRCQVYRNTVITKHNLCQDFLLLAGSVIYVPNG